MFGMAGPLFGDAVFALMPAIASWSESLPALSEFPAQVALCAVVFLFGIPYAYLVGFLPAVLAGLLATAMTRRLPSGLSDTAFIHVLTGAVCGGISGIVLLLALDIGDRLNGIPRPDAWWENGMYWLLLSVSMLAGAGCQWLVLRWQRRQGHASAAGGWAADP